MTQKQSLTQTQGVFLLCAVLSSNAVLFGNLCSGVRDIWLSILLACLFMVPLVLLFARLLQLFPGMDIFAILERCLGRVAGGVCIALLVLYAFMEGGFSLRVFTEFIHITSLKATPAEVIMFITLAVCVYLGRSGTRTLGRWALTAVPVILGILALSILSSSTELDFSNLKPVLEDGFWSVLPNAAFKVMYPFGEWVLLLGVLHTLRPGVSSRRTFLWAVALGGVLLLATFLRNITLLGQNVFSQVYFPNYYSSKASNVSTTFGRMEFLVFLTTIISYISKMTVCLIFVCRGLGRLLRLGGGVRVMPPAALLMMGIGVVASPGITQIKMLLPKLYPYCLPLFQAFIPLVCWLTAECRKKSISPLMAAQGGGGEEA